MKRNQWAAAGLAVLLFFAGSVVGALAHRYYTATTVNAKTAEDWRHQYTSEMRSRLKLTDTQMNQLDSILDDTKQRVKAVRDSTHPAMLKIKNDQINRVKSILTPEQIPAYEQLVAERERRGRELEDQERHAGRRHSGEHHLQPTQ